MSEIDWSQELRKVERQFDGLPPEPSPAEVRARLAAEREAREKQDAAGNAVSTWARLLLVASLAVALVSWPYPRNCGPGLFGYLAKESMLVVGALWILACTWRHRMARTHALALGMLLTGLALLEIEVLPRVGYARAEAARPPGWWCADSRPTWRLR
jgi:hypothetical protein